MTSPKIATLCDHFDQGSINSALWSAPAGGSLGTIEPYAITTALTLSPSYAGISLSVPLTIPAVVCTGGTVGLKSQLTYDLTNSGVSVELPQWTHGGSGWSAGFTLTSGGNYVGFILNNAPEVGAIDSNSNGNWFTYTPSGFTYLRIRESSGTVYWDYSADGVSWTNAFSEADPFALTDVTVNLYITGSGTPAAEVVWANVDYVL